MTLATQAPPRLSESICSLLSMLTGRRPAGALYVSGRTESGIDSGFESWIRASDLDGRFIPPQVLVALERGRWSLYVTLATRPDVGAATAARAHALMASWTIRRVFQHPSGDPARTTGRRWILPPERVAEVERAIDGFSIPPALVIFGGTPLAGGGYSLTALYALNEPLPVDTPTEERRALALLRRLGRAIGSDVPPEDARIAELVVPVPGGIIRENRGLDLVRVLHLDPDRVTSPAALEAAIAGAAPASKPPTDTARARRRAKESS